MTEVLYPIGYGRRLGTMQEVIDYMSPDWIEPEYAKRIQAWFKSRGGDIGPGGAMRLVQPDKDGFAPPGMSFHERQYFNDGARKYMACDLVHRNGNNVHRAPTWAEVPRQGSGHSDIRIYGVHCNVNGEPWHMQCIEFDGYLTWVNQGRKHPITFILPQDPDNPSVPPGSFTVPELTSLQEGAPNNPAHVSVMQAMLNRWRPYQTPARPPDLVLDGAFGPATKAAVVDFQNWFKTYMDGNIPADGICGPYTWNALYSDC